MNLSDVEVQNSCDHGRWPRNTISELVVDPVDEAEHPWTDFLLHGTCMHQHLSDWIPDSGLAIPPLPFVMRLERTFGSPQTLRSLIVDLLEQVLRQLQPV